MKAKNSDIAVKIFLVVVAVILVGLIIAWSTGVFKDKRNDLNEGTQRINNAIGSMVEFDLLAYDGGGITGDLLLDLIKEVQENRLEVVINVKTAESGSSLQTFNPGSTSPTPIPSSNRTNADYINPNGIFVGEVKRNDNGIIEHITFTQK